ncbi:MAG TPA: response regulator [bacterium]|nr:response regulator [bacterium]HPS28692.1 response regulator [bacterium]
MKTVKVIVVDDEFGIREGIRRVLSKVNMTVPGYLETVSFDVSVFETGEDGIAALSEKDFDICLLDNKLPGICGTEVLEFIKTADIHKPLTIMITAFPSVETADIAMENGAFGFLGKPFRPDELKNVILTALIKLLGGK